MEGQGAAVVAKQAKGRVLEFDIDSVAGCQPCGNRRANRDELRLRTLRLGAKTETAGKLYEACHVNDEIAPHLLDRAPAAIHRQGKHRADGAGRPSGDIHCCVTAKRLVCCVDPAVIHYCSALRQGLANMGEAGLLLTDFGCESCLDNCRRHLGDIHPGEAAAKAHLHILATEEHDFGSRCEAAANGAVESGNRLIDQQLHFGAAHRRANLARGDGLPLVGKTQCVGRLAGFSIDNHSLKLTAAGFALDDAERTHHAQ